MNAPRSSQIVTPPLCRWCDRGLGALLLGIAVFAPWAFASTVSWAIWTVCGAGYAMAALLFARWMICRVYRFEPADWAESRSPSNPWPGRCLLIGAILLLLYALVSGLNWRATMDPASEGEFRYRDAWAWLPHSFDGPRSLRAAWRYAALAGIFFGARVWLRGKSERELSLERLGSHPAEDTVQPDLRIPDRLRALLWTLVLSSALLAVTGALQRMSGSSKLLWLVPARPNLLGPAEFDPRQSFGPFNYRGNAATYFNLVWPLCLGFWWFSRREMLIRRGVGLRTGSEPHTLLLPLAGILMVCPLLTASRGGSIILAGQFAACCVVMAAAGGRSERRTVFGAAATFAASSVVGILLAGPDLTERMRPFFLDIPSDRAGIHEVARRMAPDFAPFGSGPETFTSLYGIYRNRPEDVWEAFAHNDYLETWVTFGSIGSSLILATFLFVPLNSFRGRAAPIWWPMPAFVWIALLGMLAQARFDFPFQVFSLLTLFLILLATLSILQPRTHPRY